MCLIGLQHRLENLYLLSVESYYKINEGLELNIEMNNELQGIIEKQSDEIDIFDVYRKREGLLLTFILIL